MKLASTDPSTELVRLGDALGTEHVAINRYRIAPGDGFPGGLHAHADQEEVFVVVTGEATFETPDGQVIVAAGEAVRFPPGEFQTGENRGDSDLVAFALGAPRESDDVRLPAACPDCDAEEVRLDTAGTRLTFRCPGCGGDALGFTTADDRRPLVECDDCGARFADAPLKD